MILIYQDVNFTRKNIVTIAKLIFQNKSPIRIFHNIFLETIQIEDRVLDLGCGDHSSYLNFIKKNKANIFFADKTIKKGKNFIKVDLEKKINIKDFSFDNILLFNVFFISKIAVYIIS